MRLHWRSAILNCAIALGFSNRFDCDFKIWASANLGAKYWVMQRDASKPLLGRVLLRFAHGGSASDTALERSPFKVCIGEDKSL